MHDNTKQYSKSTKISLITIHTLSIIQSLSWVLTMNLYTILPSHNDYLQLQTCRIHHIIATLILGCYILMVLFYFTIRLENSLKHSMGFEYSSTCLNIYRISAFMACTAAVVGSSLNSKHSWVVKIDGVNYFNHYPYVCSSIEHAQQTNMGILYGVGMLVILLLNAIIWYMFVRKLIIMIRHSHAQRMNMSQPNLSYSSRSVDGVVDIDKKKNIGGYEKLLLEIIKKQTLLITILCLNTLICWGIQGAFMFGYAALNIDFIVNITCIFLSVSYTNDYYNALRCAKYTKNCCGWIETIVLSKSTDVENLEIVVQQNQKDKSTNAQSV